MVHDQFRQVVQLLYHGYNSRTNLKEGWILHCRTEKLTKTIRLGLACGSYIRTMRDSVRYPTRICIPINLIVHSIDSESVVKIYGWILKIFG